LLDAIKPNTDIIQAGIGNNSSYAWRSIYNAIWVIQKGTCWKVGNGAKINIWKDNWIPSHNNYRIITPEEANSNITYVQDLINREEYNWDFTTLNSTLFPIDINNVTQIPLININNNDELM